MNAKDMNQSTIKAHLKMSKRSIFRILAGKVKMLRKKLSGISRSTNKRDVRCILHMVSRQRPSLLRIELMAGLKKLGNLKRRDPPEN